jgi:hypothetical protein
VEGRIAVQKVDGKNVGRISYPPLLSTVTKKAISSEIEPPRHQAHEADHEVATGQRGPVDLLGKGKPSKRQLNFFGASNLAVDHFAAPQ